MGFNIIPTDDMHYFQYTNNSFVVGVDMQSILFMTGSGIFLSSEDQTMPRSSTVV